MLKKMDKNESMSGSTQGLRGGSCNEEKEEQKEDGWDSQKPVETGWPTEVCEESRKLA